MSDLAAYGEALLLVTAVLGAIASWYRWGRPLIRQWAADRVAVRDALLGRDEIKDSITGKTISPALPGIGVRMANVETGFTMLVDQHERLADLEGRVGRLERHSCADVEAEAQVEA